MGYKPIRVLNRGLAVLEALNRKSPRTAGDVAAELGMPRGTVLRLCETLRVEGFLARSSDKQYRLTNKIRLLSGCFDDEEWISRLALPLLEKFAKASIWPVGIATLATSGDRMYVRVHTDARHVMQLTSNQLKFEYYRSILGSAVGLALLSHLEKPVQSAILDILASSSPYEEDRIARNRKQVFETLGNIRRSGFALRHADRAKISHLALPVMDKANVPVAALFIRYFSTVLDRKEAVGQFLKPLKRLADDISGLYADYHTMIGSGKAAAR